MSLMRNLGQFVGHVWKGIRTDVRAPDSTRRVVRHETEEEQRGHVTLRRTTIEEIEITEPPASDRTS